MSIYMVKVEEPASKLSYLGERSESRENARASGEAAWGQTGELACRLKVEERMKVEYLCLLYDCFVQ